ncbi:MAG: response regulator transcription factor [Colwellia sp.]
MNSKILVVDDDPHIREVISFSLARANFDTVEAVDGKQALEMFKVEQPDLIILDVGMPELEGTDVCKIIRQESQVPLVFLSARDDEIDRILGLELGADDYITKPFSTRELVARIKTILRRSNLTKQMEVTSNEVTHGFLLINTDTRDVLWNKKKLELTATEFQMLYTMAKRPNHVFSRELLMDGSYSHNVAVSDRTIDSHLRRIRNKFKSVGGAPIDTLHGVGYRVNTCDKLISC